MKKSQIIARAIFIYLLLVTALVTCRCHAEVIGQTTNAGNTNPLAALYIAPNDCIFEYYLFGQHSTQNSNAGDLTINIHDVNDVVTEFFDIPNTGDIITVYRPLSYYKPGWQEKFTTSYMLFENPQILRIAYQAYSYTENAPSGKYTFFSDNQGNMITAPMGIPIKKGEGIEFSSSTGFPYYFKAYFRETDLAVTVKNK